MAPFDAQPGVRRSEVGHRGEAPARTPGLREVSVRRRGGHLEPDYVVVEEPLEIRVNGRPLVVTMRTPGQDLELAAGFLYSEGVVKSAEDVVSLSPESEPMGSSTGGSGTAVPGCVGGGSRVLVELRGSVGSEAIEHASREFRATAACGVCGKEKIEDLGQELPEILPVACAPELLDLLPDRMRRKQELFELTGGIHAAGLFTLAGDLVCVREDVGRHNAVDKVVGHCFLERALPLRDRILVVSGRAGFEVVQKALKAAVPVMVSVGAASSLAVDMATHAGLTLYSFVGPSRGNLHVRA